MLIKSIKIIRNNWKKSVALTGLCVVATTYAKKKYSESLLLKAYCEEAKKVGDSPLRNGEKLRRITVFLNPAASNGKGRSLYEKNVAPLLHLAGLDVTLVKTEHEGQAKQFMDVLDNTDAILIAGGDGTLLEVVTGLLRRKDEAQFSRIPLGVIPLGQNNFFARFLSDKDHTSPEFLWDLTMAIVKGTTRSANVLHVQGEDKSVFSLTGFSWGSFCDAELRKQRYWYFGPLKHRLTYLLTTLMYWPPVQKATLTYSPPCDGCSRCYVKPPEPQWRWWHLFLPPQRQLPAQDFSNVTNDQCGSVHTEQLNVCQFTAVLPESVKNLPSDKNQGIIIKLLSSDVSKTDFIKQGFRRLTVKDDDVVVPRCIPAGQFELNPSLTEGKESWFIIDNEQFEAMQVQCRLLRNKLSVFCSVMPTVTATNTIS